MQYFIAWRGDLSAGSKINSSLTVTGSDAVELDELTVALSNNYYTITYTKGTQSGTIALTR